MLRKPTAAPADARERASPGLARRILTVLALLVLAPAGAFADGTLLEVPGSAGVAVVEATAITGAPEYQDLHFGTIAPPTSGTALFTVDAFNGALSIGGDGVGQRSFGGQHRGLWHIFGANGYGISIVVNDGNTCDTPAVLLNVDVTQAISSVPTFDYDLFVGGALTVTAPGPGSPLAPGMHSCSYRVTVDYAP